LSWVIWNYAEAARQITGQMDIPAAGKVDEEPERVARAQQCLGGHAKLASALVAGLTFRRRPAEVWVL
jgi:hypothetical protein